MEGKYLEKKVVLQDDINMLIITENEEYRDNRK